MGILTTEEIAELLVLPEGLLVQAVFSNQDRLTIRLICPSAFASCPHCQEVSQRIHGHYGRTLADLPCTGRRVVLALTIRKFVCSTTRCPCQIFTERLSNLTQPYARMTNRLRAALEVLGLATSGEAGARVSEQLGMPVTPFRLLQALRKTALPAPTEVSVVGIDDWCWKKGTTYGTIIVDLETRQPIELLPDRSVKTVEAWLRSHPEITIVSRDRGGDYAAAARNGAPQAEQIADRFHLLLNLRAKLKDLMIRQHKLLPMSAIKRSDAVPQKARGRSTLSAPPTPEESALLPLQPLVEPAPLDVDPPELFDQTNRVGRYEAVNRLWKQGKSIHFIATYLSMSRVTVRRYLSSAPPPDKPPVPASKTDAQIRRAERAERVLQLRNQGNSIDTIARHLKIARMTVRRYLKDTSVFDPIPVPRRKHLLDPFKPYILARWEAGCRNGSQLYREIERHGYAGSDSMLRLFLSKMRKQQQTAETGSDTSPGVVRHRISPASSLSERNC